jgi:hypothetical protein
MESLSLLAFTSLSCRLRSTAKRILIGATVASVLPSMAYALSRPVLLDLANHELQAPAIKQIVSNCLLSPESILCSPDFVFTRGDFAVAMQRMFGLTKPSSEIFFADVPANSPIHAAVEAAAPFMNNGILCPGCLLSANFSPDKPISQAQVAVDLVRLLIAANKLKLLSLSEADRVLAHFLDASSIPGLARPFIATAVNARIIPLFHVNRLDPTATYSRAEGAVVLRAVQRRYGLLSPDDDDDDSRRRDDDDHRDSALNKE